MTALRTFGVEEELLLVDPAQGRPAAKGDAVVRASEALSNTDEALVEHEFKKEQAEIGSEPRSAAVDLREDLMSRRRHAAAAAAAHGVQVAALATSPFKVRPTATINDRYERMNSEFGLLARQQLTCGQHVHVAVDSRAEGVGVLDRITPWLSVLMAISTNSPFWQGQDSGYASYRTLAWSLWPTAGAFAGFGAEAGYDQAIADLLAAGSALDDGMIYFDARLSARYPTVEIRVADVCTDVEDSVLIGVLARALVDTAAAAWQTGEPAPVVRSELLRAATWRAARSGMSGPLVDVLGRRAMPAFDLFDALVDLVGPALDASGDRELVAQGRKRLHSDGTGAARQREAFSRGGLREVVRDAVERTLA